MTLLPRSLFGRLALLLLAVVALAVLATILLFRHDRAALLVRQFSDTKIVQLQAMRAALESDRRARAPRDARPASAASTACASSRRASARSSASRRCGPLLQPISRSGCAKRSGPGTEVRVAPRLAACCSCASTPAATGYWIGFPLPPRAAGRGHPVARADSGRSSCSPRAARRRLRVRALSRAPAARARPPPSSASAAARRRRRCRRPGPSEIADVNRGFNG